MGNQILFILVKRVGGGVGRILSPTPLALTDFKSSVINLVPSPHPCTALSVGRGRSGLMYDNWHHRPRVDGRNLVMCMPIRDVNPSIVGAYVVQQNE